FEKQDERYNSPDGLRGTNKAGQSENSGTDQQRTVAGTSDIPNQVIQKNGIQCKEEQMLQLVRFCKRNRDVARGIDNQHGMACRSIIDKQQQQLAHIVKPKTDEQ